MSETGHDAVVQLCCPKCSHTLSTGTDALSCSRCGASYPVINGIPRLIQSDFYWGEMEQQQAREFVEVARRAGWKEAVARRYTPAEDGWISVLDWQRASWIPLLELPQSATVLDIGSGYGALTHSLAEYFDEVHSIDAIPERVEFTRTRLDQEGLDNVHLIVGSAINLPYPANSFDAIIVNGVLEWIGDWDTNGSPRDAQLRFLRKLHTLLKPGGRIMVGIENRLSWASFQGMLDHSGLRYTNLLPRPLATLAMRSVAFRHHRMKAPSRSYRTYTYTESGFRELFSESGFAKVDGYWAEPGYNQPYLLAPLEDRTIASVLHDLQTNPFMARPSITARVKSLFAKAGILRNFVPNYVFFLNKEGPREATWRAMLPKEVKRDDATLVLTTHKFGQKTTIRLTAPGQDGVVIKCSTPAANSIERVAAEFSQLENIAWHASQSQKPLPFRAAVPIASSEFGALLVTVESRVRGDQMQRMVAHASPAEFHAFLARHVPKLGEAASAIAQLTAIKSQPVSAASWLEAAQTVVSPELVARAKSIGDSYRDWVCHGDLTLENCMLDQQTDTISIIDWEFVRQGVPPLYDFFCTCLSILNSVTPPDHVRARFDNLDVARFYTVFFHANPISQLLAHTFHREGERLGLDRSRAWRLFEDSLLFRIGYLIERRSNVAESRLRFINAMQEWKGELQFQ